VAQVIGLNGRLERIYAAVPLVRVASSELCRQKPADLTPCGLGGSLVILPQSHHLLSGISTMSRSNSPSKYLPASCRKNEPVAYPGLSPGTLGKNWRKCATVLGASWPYSPITRRPCIAFGPRSDESSGRVSRWRRQCVRVRLRVTVRMRVRARSTHPHSAILQHLFIVVFEDPQIKEHFARYNASLPDQIIWGVGYFWGDPDVAVVTPCSLNSIFRQSPRSVQSMRSPPAGHADFFYAHLALYALVQGAPIYLRRPF